MPKAPMSTPELLRRLERHYVNPDDPGGVFAREVCVNGEFGSGRRCDALYAGFTSASGRILIGHEVKTSRGDWLSELQKPSKSEVWAEACHEWWIVAPSTDVVRPEEVPAGWGLLLPPAQDRHTRFKVEVRAARRDPDAFSPPWWAVRSLMARLSTLGRRDENALRQVIRTQVAEDLAADREKAIAVVRDQYREAQDRLRQVEDALGVPIRFWESGPRSDVITLAQLAEIGAAIRRGRDVEEALEKLVHPRRAYNTTALTHAEKTAKAAADLIDALHALKDATAPAGGDQ